MQILKKYTLAILALSSSVSAVQAVPFEGSYLGGFMGGEHTTVKASAEEHYKVSGDSIKWEGTSRKSDFQYGLMAGYGTLMNHFYIGGEVSAFHSTGGNNQKYGATEYRQNTATGVQNVVGDYPNYAVARIKYERSLVFSLAPRIGYVIGKNFLIFTKLGLEMSNDEISVNIEGENKRYKASHSEFVLAFAPGLGLEYAITNNLLGRIEYTYSGGPRIEHLVKGDNLEDTGNGNTSTQKTYSASRRSHSIKLGLSYQF